MRFQNPHYLSTLQKRKIRDIKEYARDGINPLDVICHSDNSYYGYTVEDVRNYFEATNKEFDLIIK